MMSIKIGREKIKLSLFTDDSYTENPSEFSKYCNYK